MRFTCSETICKKKKNFAHALPSGRVRRFQNTQSHWELKNKSWIRKFRKHLHGGPKNTRQNKNSKFEIYFLTYCISLKKRAFSRVALGMVKTNFLYLPCWGRREKSVPPSPAPARSRVGPGYPTESEKW